MDNLLKTIERFANLKGVVSLLILLLVSFFVYRNLDFITEVTFKVDKSPTRQSDSPAVQESPQQTVQAPSKGGRVDLEIAAFSITPVDFHLPKYLYFEIHNSGNASADNVLVSIDLGRSTLIDLEVNSISGTKVLRADSSRSLVKIALNSIAAEESAYFYLLISDPSFKRIVVSANNIAIDYVRTMNELDAEFRQPSLLSDTVLSFLRFTFSAIIGVFSIFFVYAVISLLGRWLKIEEPASDKKEPLQK